MPMDDNNGETYTIIQAKKIIRLMPGKRKNQFVLLLVAMLLLAFAETISVGLIAFYAAAIYDPLSTLETLYVDFVRFLFGSSLFDTPKILISVMSVAVICTVVFNFFAGGLFIPYPVSVLVTYAMYVVTLPNLIYTIPLCTFGFLCYMTLVESGSFEVPTEALLKDVPLLFVGLLWTVMIRYTIYVLPK